MSIEQNQLHKLTQLERQQLRESHFTLGGDQRADPRSEQQKEFKNHQDAKDTIADNPVHKEQHVNHFALGNDPAVFASHYDKHMPDYSQDIQEGMTQVATAKRPAQLTVGNMPPVFKSEAQSYQYDPSKITPNFIPEVQKQELYISHLKFNDITKNKYQTNQQQDFTEHNTRPNVLPQEQLANLKYSDLLYLLGAPTSLSEATATE